MAYTTVNKSIEHFDAKIYTGNGSSQTLDMDNLGLLWMKNRTEGSNHNLFDSVRGGYYTSAPGPNLRPNGTTAGHGSDITSAYGITFGSSSSTIGSDGGGYNYNQNGKSYVAWQWRANGAGSSNTDGTITSTVSANTTSGFSIVKWVGTNATGTVGHGLGATPKLVIYKNLNDSTYWYFTTTVIDGSHDLLLWPVKDAVQPFSAPVPTSSVLNLIANNDTNGSSDNIIAYCFAEKQGFSKFGTYVGNGNSNGTFVYTGFKPAFVLVKMYTSTSNGNWTMHDNSRSSSGGFNHIDKTLYPHLSNSEDTGTGRGMDMLSNGFKFTGNDEGNTSNQNYIYMAFSEAPLVGTNNVPCTAR